MLIKVVLMVAIAAIALFLLKGYRGARHLAIRRLLLLGFVVGAGASLLLPQLWTAAADLLGVGRGTDLLLYATIVAFLGFVATSYLRFRDLQREITALTRRIALDEAQAARTLHLDEQPAQPALRLAAASDAQGERPAPRAAPSRSMPAARPARVAQR